MNKQIICATLAVIFTFLSASTNVKASGETKEFDINGLKVLFKPSPKEVISARLIIDGGTANYSKEKEGIEALALQLAIEGGTESMSKIEFSSEAEKIGARFSSSTTYDFGTMNMTCIKMFWDRSWELFAEAVMNPAFDEKEFNIIKEQLIAEAKHVQSDPDAHLRNLAMQNVFKGTNYAEIPEGTEESLKNLTVEDVKAYYNNIIGKKRCFLVVVGKVDEQDLKKKITATLANLPEGKAAPEEKRVLIKKPAVYIEDRDIATNYIRGMMSAPTMNSDEGVPIRLAMSILRDRFFIELRTKRSLSYAPAAYYATGVLRNPYNVVSISTTDPEQSMQVMADEISKIKKEGFEEKELIDKKQTYLTYHYMELETSASQSRALGIAELLGDWRLAEKLTERVNKTTLKDINKAFDQYTNVIQWTYLGKQDMVEKKDFVQPKESENKPY